MSTRGTKESRRDKAAGQVAPETVWVVVYVYRGIPEEVRAFRTEEPAQKQLSKWRRKINLDYDDAGIFEVPIEDAPAKRPRKAPSIP
jgi:hypothetical protein